MSQTQKVGSRRMVTCGILMAGLLTFLAGIGVMVGHLMTTEVPPISTDQLGEDRKVYERTDFETLVAGKTPDRVKKIIGTPDQYFDDMDEVAWVYYGRTINPETRATDLMTKVIFVNGQAVSIVY